MTAKELCRNNSWMTDVFRIVLKNTSHEIQLNDNPETNCGTHKIVYDRL